MRLGRSVRSYGLVTLITLLIWLYAEGQDVTSDARKLEITLPARVGQSTVVDFADGGERVLVSFNASGASTQLSELRTRLGSVLELTLEPDDLPAGGRATLRLEELLERAVVGGGSTIAELGVSVSSVDPAVIEVDVDQLDAREVRVVLNAEGVELASERSIEPGTVTITAPKTLFAQYAGSEDALYVEAELKGETLVQIREGVETRRALPLGLAPIFAQSKHVSIEPTAVDVTFTIVRQQSTVQPDSPLPVIWVLGQSDEYAIEMAQADRYLEDVTITGPSDLIQRIVDKDPTLRIVARLDLIGDLMPGEQSKELTQVEFQEVSGGRTSLLYGVPLNPAAVGGDGTSEQTPAFVSSQITVKAKNTVVSFTVSKRGE